MGLWLQRENRILFKIASRLVKEREYPSAVLLLQDVVQKYPNDVLLLSSLGRVQLQMGNVRAAAAVFKQAESIMKDEESSVLAEMNRGYLALALDQYTTAIDHFQAVLDKDPSNLVAVNNKAICLLYTCELGRAISTLEDLIRKDPQKNLHEVLVFNLCTLYDLKSENSQEKKKSIMSLITRFATDSFDYSVLKLTT